MNYREVGILTAAQARQAVDTPYHGALDDRLGGHMHPLNYTLGLARAAAAAGVTIHENSVALKLDRTNGIRIATAKGAVRARHAVLAGDALLTGLEPAVNSRIMPVGNYIVATEPLPDAGAIIPAMPPSPTRASWSTTSGCRRTGACCSAAASAIRRRRPPTSPLSCGRIWKRPFRSSRAAASIMPGAGWCR